MKPTVAVMLSCVAWLCVQPLLDGRARQLAAQGLPDQVLPDLLQRAGTYLSEYETALDGVVASERMAQQFAAPPPMFSGGSATSVLRDLRAEVIFFRDDVTGWVTFRDVTVVDGRPVRDRERRLADLFENGAPTARQQAERITKESAAFNLDIPRVTVGRTLNVPTSGLLFLRTTSQARSQFTLATRGGRDRRGLATLEFTEVAMPRLIRSGSNQPMQGSFDIEPSSGRVMATHLAFQLQSNQSLTEATIDVTFELDPRLSILVPVSMIEHYRSMQNGQVAGELSAKASYSGFKRFSVAVTDVAK